MTASGWIRTVTVEPGTVDIAVLTVDAGVVPAQVTVDALTTHCAPAGEFTRTIAQTAPAVPANSRALPDMCIVFPFLYNSPQRIESGMRSASPTSTANCFGLLVDDGCDEPHGYDVICITNRMFRSRAPVLTYASIRNAICNRTHRSSFRVKRRRVKEDVDTVLFGQAFRSRKLAEHAMTLLRD